MAATRPSNADSTKKTTKLGTGTEVAVSFRAETRATPMLVPISMPMRAPKTDKITDSDRTMARTWCRFMPTARNKPISRVRSNTDSMSVLTTPMSATSTASASRA